MFQVLLISLLASSGVLGQFAPSLATTAPPAPKSFDPNCKDKMDNCWKMPESNCRAPYEDWAKEYCPNRCGYCQGPTTPAPPCVNVLPNCESYDKSVCTNPDYATWAGENCRYFCRMCPPDELNRLDSITTTVKPEDCVDKVDCRQYGANACSDTFKAWSKDNCPNYCGICSGIPTPPPVCEDKIPNCKAYNPDTCTNPQYKLWVLDNCKKFCGQCASSGSTGSAPMFVPNSGKDSPTISYVPPTPPSPGKRAQEPCEDMVNCELYGKSVCEMEVYFPWAKAHCSRFCGFCVQEAERPKRQFQASHHHQGGTHDCWDGSSTDPYCNTAAPPEPESTPFSSIQGSSGFPGSEFHPHPKPDPNWDSKPSTEAPKTTVSPATTAGASEASVITVTVKPPFATGRETPTTAAPTESTESQITITSEPGETDNFTTTTDVPTASPGENSTQTEMNSTVPQGSVNASTVPPGIQGGSTLGVSETPASGNVTSVTSQPGTLAGSTSASGATQVVVGNATTSASSVVNTTVPSASQTPTGTAQPGSISPSGSTQIVLGNSTSATSSAVNTTMPSGTQTAQPGGGSAGTPPPLTVSPVTVPDTLSSSSATLTLTTTPTTSGTTTEPCEDTVDNCAMYGKSACETEVYRPWAKAHCSRFCGFCVPVTLTPFECNDKLANCKEFDGGDLCTTESYYAWALENCFAYCGFPPCGNNTGGNPAVTTTSSPVTSQSVAVKSGNSNCTDELDNCIDYPDEKCVGIYEPWARSHCAYRCGYCPDFLPCEDVNPDCDKFPPSSCVKESFKGWARRNCRKFCNLCSRPTVNPAVVQPTGTSGSVTGTMPTPEIPYSSVDPVMITKNQG